MVDVRTSVHRHNSQLYGPTGPLTHMEGLHRSGISLDRQRLRYNHCNLLDCVCHLYAVRWEIRGLDGHKERLPLGNRNLVSRCVSSRCLRMGNYAHRGIWERPGYGSRADRFCSSPGNSFHKCLAFHRCTMHPRPWWGRQLPCSHQGDSRVFPKEGPCFLYSHFQ